MKTVVGMLILAAQYGTAWVFLQKSLGTGGVYDYLANIGIVFLVLFWLIGFLVASLLISSEKIRAEAFPTPITPIRRGLGIAVDISIVAVIAIKHPIIAVVSAIVICMIRGLIYSAKEMAKQERDEKLKQEVPQ